MIYNFDYFYNLLKDADLKFELVYTNEDDKCKTLSFENLKFNLVTKYTELKNIDSEMITFSNHLVTVICNKTHTSVFRYDYIKNCVFEDNVLKIALDDNSVIEINFQLFTIDLNLYSSKRESIFN